MAATPSRRGFVLALLIFDACAAQAGDKVVTAQNYQFTPADVRIVAGQTVTWTNAGGKHNIYSYDPPFQTQPNTSPWQFSFTFKTPGTFSYVCQQHYTSFNMAGTVTVRSSNAPPSVTILSPG